MLQVSSPTPTSGHRRRAIEDLLRERRLLLSRRELGSVSERADDRDTFFPRLAKACFELGPVFAAMGRYLGLRADLFEARDAFQLLDIPEAEEFAPLGEVQARLRQAFGARAERFAPHLRKATRRRGPFQIHQAQLPEGKQMTLYVVPETLLASVATELVHLEILKTVLAIRGWDETSFEKALHSFRQQFTRLLDLEAKAVHLEQLATWGEENGRWSSPRPVLQASGLLALEGPRSLPLAQILDVADPAQGRKLAIDACAIWLRLALVLNQCPTSLEFEVLETGHLTLTDGTFHPVPKNSGANLWTYLRATAAHDPDHAFACLEREIGPPKDPRKRFVLRQKVRQAVPFRDGSWTPEAQCLSEILMLHWRYLDAESYPAPSHLEAFYGGIFSLAGHFERRFQNPDLLREALEDLEWSAGQAQFRSLFAPTQLGESMNAALSTFAELPQRVDHLLDLLSRDEGPPIRVRPSRADRKRQNRLAAAIALMLFMAGLVILSGHPDLAERFGESIEIARTTLFVTLATLLFFLMRGKS